MMLKLYSRQLNYVEILMSSRRLLVCGVPASGKTYCLRGLKDHEKTLFLNCEASKGNDLPFKNKFKKVTVTDPTSQLLGDNGFFEQLQNTPKDKVSTIIIDSLTFLMDLYETKYIAPLPKSQSMQAWAGYRDFINNLCNVEVPKVKQDVVFTAHIATQIDENTLQKDTRVKLKGSIMNNGVEALFNNIVYTKKLPLSALENYSNDYLHITEDDELLGFKHVIQTRPTRDTLYEKVRSPGDMWSVKETFIDGNIQFVLDRLNDYYGD